MSALNKKLEKTLFEYEVLYFANGRICSMLIIAENKKSAHQMYLELGLSNNDLFSIRPDH